MQALLERWNRGSRLGERPVRGGGESIYQSGASGVQLRDGLQLMGDSSPISGHSMQISNYVDNPCTERFENLA